MGQIRGKRDYLFKRSETGPWWIKLQPPKRMTNGKLVEKSLGTTDRAEAELLALPYIEDHKRLLLAARAPEGVTAWRHEYAPGVLHDAPDGGKIYATERELHYLDANNRRIATSPNGGPGSLRFAVPATHDRPSLPVKGDDDVLVETYITHAGLNASHAKECRDLWHTFRRVVNKPLAKCDRTHGRTLVAHLEAQTPGIKSATLRRKMVPLVACVNLAISEGKLTFNPFAGVTPYRGDSKRRKPFDNHDMKLIRAHVPKLSVQDQLLVRTLAMCGLRLSECFQIDREYLESGCRYIIVGSKTDSSLRRVPLPKALLPLLPKKITGPLFVGKPNPASTRLSKWLREVVGITDTAKVAAHSYRHRAQDRLRAAGCPKDIRKELLGHDEKTVHDNYGEGSPVPMLRKWVDKIGF